MDLVEQFRHPLDFIHDDPILVVLRNSFSEPLRRCEQLRVHLIVEHVEEQRVGKLLL
jgi:hypothetical protein